MEPNNNENICALKGCTKQIDNLKIYQVNTLKYCSIEHLHQKLREIWLNKDFKKITI